MAHAFKTQHYLRLTVLPETRNVKSTLNRCYVDINTAGVLFSAMLIKTQSIKGRVLCIKLLLHKTGFVQ